MNADGSRHVDVRVNVAAQLPMLTPIAAGLLVGGFIFLALSIVLILIPVRAAKVEGRGQIRAR